MKSSSFLSFGIENILKDTPVFTRDLNETSVVKRVGEHLHDIVYDDVTNTASSSPCPSSPSLPSSDESAEPEDTQDENTEPKRKKLRTTFEPDQIKCLEDYYSKQRYLPAAERKKMALRLCLTDQQVKTWFQNRRIKDKRQQREPSKADKNRPSASSTACQKMRPSISTVQNQRIPVPITRDLVNPVPLGFLPHCQPFCPVTSHVQFTPYPTKNTGLHTVLQSSISSSLLTRKNFGSFPANELLLH